MLILGELGGLPIALRAALVEWASARRLHARG